MSPLLSRVASRGAAAAARPPLPRILTASGTTTTTTTTTTAAIPRLPASGALIAVRRAATAAASETKSRQTKDLFTRFAKLDPELYGIMTVTLGAVGAFAYFFAGNPTGNDARHVPAVPGSEPWRAEGGSSSGKYMYYPGGDIRSAPREAPSALNVAVLPMVNLPKELHEKYNKYGKDGYDF